MDLKIKGQLFIVGGAGSGFGKAITEALALEGATVLAVSRTASKLKLLQAHFPDHIETLAGDITTNALHQQILKSVKGRTISGVVVNGGGPPAGNFHDIEIDQWQEGWRSIVQWKISLTKLLLPLMQQQQYGRMVFIESVSVKQMVPNLILSNALRPAVVGFAKSLSREVADSGITINVLAPGYHLTAALDRLFVKKSALENISKEEAQALFEKETPVKPMGTPEEMATLALWLLSPLSRYVTGQTITHDGGIVQGLWG